MTDAAPPPAIAIVEALRPDELKIYGIDRRLLVILDLKTGKVTLLGSPNEAARVFWRIVEQMHPACRKDEKDVP